MKKQTNKDPEFLFWVLFIQTYRAMARLREKELDKLGITFLHAGVISIIKELGNNATPTEISRRMLRKSHTVTELIDRMIKMGLVQKLPNNKRKNGVVVLLTEKGEETYIKVHEIKTLRRLISALPETQRKYLEHSFRLMRNNALNELSEFQYNWVPPKLTDP